MKRWIPVCAGLFLGMAVLLARTAISYEDFTGLWYSCSGGEAYLFHQGIVCREDSAEQMWAMDGAYSVSRDTMFLFASGVEGLEQEQNIYLIHRNGADVLCENRDGTGTIYFTRQPPEM